MTTATLNAYLARTLPRAVLTRDELIVFERLLRRKLSDLKRVATMRGGYSSQNELSQAVEIAKITTKIEQAFGETDDAELPQAQRAIAGAEAYQE